MSTQTPDVYIHIGMHKAVSSFLQEGSFDLLAKQRAMLYIDCYFNRGLKAFKYY